MLEFIGFITLCFLFYKIIASYFKKKIKTGNTQSGSYIRYFAINELNVPYSYFNYITNKNINAIKNKAMDLRNSDPIFKDVEWTRLMAASIYLSFNKHCQSTEIKDKKILDVLKVDTSIIEIELDENPYKVARHFIQAGKNYELSTDNEIKNLIVECSKLSNRQISYPKLFDRISLFAYDNYTTEFFGDYTGLRFFLDDVNNKVYDVLVEPLEPEKGQESSINIKVKIVSLV